jgi:DNA-binding NarL/FixJ family response regulator
MLNKGEGRSFAAEGGSGAALAAGFATALIVDDHPLFCDALSMTLTSVCGVRTVATAASLAAALAHVESHGRPDVAVLDLHLPDVDGLDGLIRLKAAVAPTPVVVVSSIEDARVIASASHAGASGYVPKHSPRAVFQEAFAAVEAGEVWFPDGPLDAAFGAGEAKDAVSRLATLTKQQARILDLICEGKLNKQIAYDLSIAETTVKAHVTAIMRKLGVHSRTQAVLVAREASFASVLKR